MAPATLSSMSTRPASPPPVTRWKFVLGALVFVALGVTWLLFGADPLDAVGMLVLLLCLAVSATLCLAPYLIEYDARLRLAEAHARDHAESQVRRLTQVSDQLMNAVSRSQSTEEQAGQALGTLEELAERLAGQAEEIAQQLARVQERDSAALKAEVERLARERDERLAALEQRIDTANGQISELQLASRKAASSLARTLDDLRDQLGAIAARLDAARAAPGGRAPAERVAATPEIQTPDSPADASPEERTAEPHRPRPQAEPDGPGARAMDPGSPTATAEAGASGASSVASRNDVPVASSRTGTPSREAATAAPAAKPRARRSHDSAAPARVSARPETLDLPLVEVKESHPKPRRNDPGAGTSTLVATAYIGIGNKLYVRGEGPGLSWERGVPMQFLAIGKWGWTSPDTTAPITCRIYRNDDTPMLDDNIVIEPGARAEVTPRF